MSRNKTKKKLLKQRKKHPMLMKWFGRIPRSPKPKPAKRQQLSKNNINLLSKAKDLTIKSCEFFWWCESNVLICFTSCKRYTQYTDIAEYSQIGSIKLTKN